MNAEESSPSHGTYAIPSWAPQHGLKLTKRHTKQVSTDLAFNASVTPLYNDRMYISTNGSYGISDQLSPSFNHYQVDYYRSQTEADRRNQYTDATNTSHHAQAGASFNYTLDKKYHHSIGANYNLNYTSSRNRNYLYLLNKLEGWKSDERALGELPSTELLGRAIDAGNSTRSHSRTLTQQPRFSYSYSIYNDTTHQMLVLSLPTRVACTSIPATMALPPSPSGTMLRR